MTDLLGIVDTTVDGVTNTLGDVTTTTVGGVTNTVGEVTNTVGGVTNKLIKLNLFGRSELGPDAMEMGPVAAPPDSMDQAANRVFLPIVTIDMAAQ